jgi:hypothetical protein
MGGGPFVSLDVAGELLADARAQHLDRHRTAIGGHAAVDLRDRGGADWFRIDAGEKAFQRPVESRLDFALDRCERHRRQAVLQAHQVAGGFLADQVGPGRQRLAELDRRRSDRLEGSRVVGLARLDRAQPGQLAQPSHRTGSIEPFLDDPQRAVTCEHPAPAQQPEDMSGGAGQAFQPE